MLADLIVAQLVAFHGLKDGRRQAHPAGNDLIGQLRIGILDSPYKAIGVCVQGDALGIIASYGHKGIGYGSQQDCAFECVVKLEGLISLIAKGVCKFVEEDPERDREYSTGKELSRQGVVDFRSINKKQSF